ncbi:AsmA family protein [Phreatobacter oligotrophus]|uniref:AsmA-like protein n=1 Tax=Phreatobacter oligotrophus TaxID=1122261 RepID=A0A2T4ZGV3_9HYPH|nr:AsmA family protein [Phreatobacter oligotrophus]PTM61123.1 AsmA-like protein [Phreatobacter oligotrophus]
MQNTLLALAIALIAAIVAALVGPFLVDWNAHRPRIEAEATRLFGTPVRIGGDLTVRLLPTISIDARDVAIGEGQGGARIGRLRGDLRIAPLLRGQASLNSLHIRDADVTLRGGMAPSRLFAVDALTIENARLSVAEGEGPARLVAERLMLTGESRGQGGPLRLEGTAVAGETVHPVSALLSLTDAGRLAARLRVAAGPGGGFGFEVEGLASTEGRPRLDGEVVLSGGAGRLPWRLAGPVAVTPQALIIQRAEGQLGSGDRLVRATGSFRLGFGPGEGVEAVASILQADLDRLIEGPQRLPRDTLAALLAEAPALAAPAVPVTLSLEVAGLTIGAGAIGDLRGDIRADDSGWRIERLAARLPGDAAADIAGRLTLAGDVAFSGTLALQAARPAALMAWLDGQQAPAGTLDDPIRLATRVTADPGRLVLDAIDAETAAGRTTGRIALDVPALGRHALLAELSAEALDLDLLVRIARGAGARLDPATDTRLRVRAARASLAGLVARDLDLAVATDGRTFEAERLSIGDLAGFGMDLTGRLDGLGGPLLGRLSGRARAETVDGLVALLSRHAATRELAGWIRDRAPSLAGADLGLTFAASGRSALGLRIEGRVGEATVQLDAAGSGDPFAPRDLTGRVRLDLDAPRADRIVALVAGTPVAAAGSGAAKLTAEWIRADAETHRLSGTLTSGPTTITADFGRGRGGEGSLSATLRSTDIAPLMPLLGVPAELSGRLAARLDIAARAAAGVWRTDRAEGEIGGTRLAGRLSLAGHRLSGDLALGTLPAEAALALLSGPAWLIDAGAGEFAAAAFGGTVFDRLDTDVVVTADRLLLGSYPDLVGLKASLVRDGGRTRLAGLTAAMGPATVAADVTLDRSDLRTLASARVGLDRVPAALLWPGAEGTASVATDVTADGATPAALLAGLRGSGRLAFALTGLSGADPAALARVTRQAEIAQDLGRPMTDMAFGAALAQALDGRVAVPATPPAAINMSGLILRAASVTAAPAGGTVTWSGSVDLREGTLAAQVKIAPDPLRDAETMPVLAIRHDGALGGPDRVIETDDVSGWLGLRLVDRAALRIRMTESDRLERNRQRAFSRFTALPPPQVEIPMPPMPEPLAPEMFLPPRVTVPAEPSPEATPVPAPRPNAPRAAPTDLPSVVRRALDGRPVETPAPPAAPLSILPPLPPAVEVGPAPGMRR